MRFADHVEAHHARIDLVSVSRLICELDPIIFKDGMDPVWHCLEEMFEELPRGFSISFVNQLGHRKLAGSVNADKEIQFPFSRLHLSNTDMKEAYRIALELLPPGFVATYIFQL